jgi:hypothetical protein|tara:strand:- start:4731 stop:5036 length:306 start_codon:yes stop_codon:yes gene_type:complete
MAEQIQLESNELTQIQTHVDLIQRGYRKTESQQYATRELENDLRDFITNMVRDKGGDPNLQYNLNTDTGTLEAVVQAENNGEGDVEQLTETPLTELPPTEV